MNQAAKSIREQWTSSLAFILASTGAAVGLGNLWKFPYIAGENGGGAFVIVYLACILLIGVPLLMAEVVIGRHGRQNPANSMKNMALESNCSRHWGWVGFLTVLAGYLILSYYTVIAGWGVDYVIQAGLGHFNQATPMQIRYLFSSLTDSPAILLLWNSIVIIATTVVVAFGIEKGIERSVKIMFPIMVVLLLIIVAYSVQLGSFQQGLNFLFHPNFSALTPEAILIAMGHAFFTLSIATGSIMMYGAYLPEKVSIPRACFFIAGADTLIALLAGLAIFPIVFAHGIKPGAGPGLLFKSIPFAFGHMPYGQVFGTLFFIMVVIAAFTSAVSLLEPMVSYLIENRGMSRKTAASVGGLGLWILGTGTVLSFNHWQNLKLFGMTYFEAMDYLTANIMLPIGGLLIAVFAAWRLNKQLAKQEIHATNGLAYNTWKICLGVITPLAVVIVFLKATGLI